MSQLSQALILVIQTLGSLYLLIVLLRFILQLVRADFYNPLSQFIVKATHPLLRPMRRVIPSMGSLDLSSLVLAIIVQMVLMALILLIAYGTTGNPLLLLVWALVGITGLFLNIFFWALIISVILSWVAPGSRSPGAELVAQITEPVLAPFRRLIPNLGGLDISPIFAFIVIQLLQSWVIPRLAYFAYMPKELFGLI